MIKNLMLMMAPVVLLAACGDPEKIDEESPAAQPAGERLGAPDDTPPARPVTIGEGGPRFDACQAMGQISGTGARGLALRDAPYDRATQTDTLLENSRVFICTRTIDQQWLGVVIPTADESVDCGVLSPVRRKQQYDGPCQSGWVEANFVKLVAG
jgi:hypothetical protein